MFNPFKKDYEKHFTTGPHLDTRPQELKDLDYPQKELVAAIAPVVWVKKDRYKTYPVRKQNGSGSCVMMSMEKERGIIAEQKYGEFIVFSANPGYKNRANPAISGSTIEDLIRATQAPAVLENMSPSMSLNDLQMMATTWPKYTEDMGKVFAAKRIFMDLDIDTIASTIENTGKGVGLTIRFGKGEWFYNKQVKRLRPESEWTMGHRCTAVDYTLNKDGVKCLVIEDSACEDGFPQRLVPEDFLMERTYWKPNYIKNFKAYVELPDKPSFDGTIKNLQDILKYEGLFDASADSTGYFGPITKKALVEFQKKYGIVPAEGVFGPVTQAKLKALYP